jgi:ribosomal protein L3 glutamine methyltransferase
MAASTFLTPRDLLRYAVSRFRAAELSFGHGATTAVDEAAFLILEALHLPVDDFNPWADARLLPEELQRVLALIEARVETRKPAAYLLKRTYIKGVPFYVDERAIVPRSYLGELMMAGAIAGPESGLIEEPEGVRSVLDLCTGSGCLAILAARVFPNARIDAVDLSAEALEVARINVDLAGLQDRIQLHCGGLFEPLDKRRYDLILTNPPYVSETEMALLPAEYRHEPAMALAGGGDGLDIVRRILKEAPAHLTPEGGLLCEFGAGRDILEREYLKTEFLWLDTEESEAEVFWLARGGMR